MKQPQESTAKTSVADMTTLHAMGLGTEIVIGGKDGYKTQQVLPTAEYVDALIKRKAAEGCTRLQTLLGPMIISIPMPKDLDDFNQKMDEVMSFHEEHSKFPPHVKSVPAGPRFYA